MGPPKKLPKKSKMDKTAEHGETLVDENKEVTLVDLVSSTEDGELNDETVVEKHPKPARTRITYDAPKSEKYTTRKRLGSEQDDQRDRKRRRSRGGGIQKGKISRRQSKVSHRCTDRSKTRARLEEVPEFLRRNKFFADNKLDGKRPMFDHR